MLPPVTGSSTSKCGVLGCDNKAGKLVGNCSETFCAEDSCVSKKLVEFGTRQILSIEWIGRCGIETD